MNIERFETKKRMSRIVIHNNTIYLCGQVAKDYTAEIKEQTKTTLEKIDELLQSVNSDKTKILSTTIYLKDMSLFSDMNEVWDAWVPEGYAPARACVEARMARDNILVEMSVIAAT